jgi:hypothetical protein
MAFNMINTMKLKFNLILIMLFSKSFCYAQSYTFYGSKIYGGNSGEAIVQILKLNNDLILAGRSASDTSGNKTSPNCIINNAARNDLWLVSIDTALNVLWNKSFGGNNQEDGPGKIIYANNQLLFGCSSKSDSSCSKETRSKIVGGGVSDFWICSVDSVGNKLWEKTYGSPGNDDTPSITLLSDGNYLILGTGSSGVGFDRTYPGWGSYDFWALKLDAQGNKIWDKSFGGTGGNIFYTSNSYNFLNAAFPTENGSFVFCGNTNSPVSGNISDAGYGGFDFWIIKVDSAGNKIWDRRYGGSQADYCSQLISTMDGGFLLLGVTNSPQDGTVNEAPIGGVLNADVWLIKLDSAGNEQWDRRYGGTGKDFGLSAVIAPGGGYWISATTSSPVGFDVSEPGYGLADYWIFKIDSAGNKLWDKRFGGPDDDFASNFVLMPDSSIFLCGYSYPGTSAVKSEYGYGGTDYWVVHFKYDDSAVGVTDYAANALQLTVTPNPAKEAVTISSKTAMKNIELFDMSGKKVFERKLLHSFFEKIMLNGLGNGVYTLRVATDEGMANKKVVVMR